MSLKIGQLLLRIGHIIYKSGIYTSDYKVHIFTVTGSGDLTVRF